MEGLNKEAEIYSEIHSFSVKENVLLKDFAPLKEVYAFIPYKMKLLEDIQQTENTISYLKEMWMECKNQAIPLPEELNLLLKKIEVILEETIRIDEQNKNLITDYIRGNRNNTLSAKKMNYVLAVNAYKGKC